MAESKEETWLAGRSETPEEALRAGSELSKIFDSIDSFYVDGAIKLRAVEARSCLGGDDKRTNAFPLSLAVTRNLLIAIDHLHSLRVAADCQLLAPLCPVHSRSGQS
ncbi:hypothetical protein J7E83_17745 [Arthrobacter sp. ISL-48]|uniref:hypothetical protein n=1 Tax=Arthrobacter sp. ISL-48 TaxID=2819110 RepID=UPI001BE5957D|nr:hypothetical protein [Arthrobacter sp. ISL-48]MBT2533934.1 hypothetical protein [Arthrobacter sp. ISL-48]